MSDAHNLGTIFLFQLVPGSYMAQICSKSDLLELIGDWACPDERDRAQICHISRATAICLRPRLWGSLRDWILYGEVENDIWYIATERAELDLDFQGHRPNTEGFHSRRQELIRHHVNEIRLQRGWPIINFQTVEEREQQRYIDRLIQL